MKLLSRIYFCIFAIATFFIALGFNAPANYPPGTVKMKIDNKILHVDKDEVLNKSYVEYLWDLKDKHGEDSQEYLNVLPDTAVWNTVYSESMASLVKSYLGKDVSDFPVVGVSHNQAVEYCKWRSERVNQKYSNKTVTYRLPTKEEWTAIFHAAANEEFLAGLNKPSGKKKIQNLTDNVSEMVSEPGIAMGGNWKTGSAEADNTTTVFSVEYDKPKNWLGFRCVAEVE